MRRRLQKSLLYILVALILVVAAGCGGGNGNQGNVQNKGKYDLGMKPDDVVVTYKGGTVTAAEFEQYLSFLGIMNLEDTTLQNPTSWPNILDDYVGQKILAARATEKGIKPNEEEINIYFTQQKEEVQKTLKGEDYNQYLAKQGLDEAKVKSFLTQFNLIDQYLLTSKSDEELKKIYDQDKSAYTIATVRHILITTEKRTDDEAKKLAEQLADRIRKGEDFAKLADQYSEDPGNTNKDGTKNGGLYKDVPVVNWVEQFKQAALTLPLNQVSDPVKTDYGYHVMRVEKREVEPFDKVKSDIAGQEGYMAYINFMSQELPNLIEKRNLPPKTQAPQ